MPGRVVDEGGERQKGREILKHNRLLSIITLESNWDPTEIHNCGPQILSHKMSKGRVN